jgi:hypothetical protein
MKATLIVFLMGLAAAACAADGSNPCQGLAAQVQRIPAADWLAPGPDPMDKLVNFRATDRPQRSLTPVEEQLLLDPNWRRQLSVGPQEPLDIERLEGTDIYRIDSFQGTATCQTMLFVEAPPAKPPRRISAPFDAPQPCTTQRARFGHALGDPLYVVGGRDSMEGLARTYRVSAWKAREKAWTPSCQLKLAFDSRLELSGRYCSSDTALCQAAAGVASAIVGAYQSNPSLDPLSFAVRRDPPPALKALLEAKGASLPPSAAELPTFSATTPRARDVFLTSFSNAKQPSRLALWLDGRWWLGVVGIAGVGWRSSTTSLLAVYAVTADGLVPAAGFQVDQLAAGSARAQWR